MNNETKIGISFDNVVKGSTELEKYAERLNTIKAALSGMDKGTLQAVKSSSKDVKDISDHTKNIDRNLGLAFNYTAMRTAARMISGIGRAMRTLTEQSSGYLEDFNLFQVAFNGNYQSAEKFVNKLSEMYGLDEDWLIRTTGLFKQMSNSMGLASDEGEKLSKLLTQMSIDISSLYNVDVNRASQVLQSSLAGQTKPIRGLTGGDITQATLQTTLDKIDTGKAVKDLDYAEKRLLIIISLTDQLSESAGDWGRTLESPANQTRILEEQWIRLTRAIGNLFLPTLAKVLPYLNAILMVITEIINSIASLFGYDLGDYDYFDSSISSAYDFDDALGTVGDSIDKVKKKMSGLRGFDKLNNMTTPSQTNSGGSGSVRGGGINPNIMKAFNKAYDDYLKKLDETKMKATEIRDKIMDWLGFTKELDPVTGKVTWHLREGVQRIHLITAGIGILVGLNLFQKIVNLAAGTSRLNKLLGIGGLAGVGTEAAQKMATFNSVMSKIKITIAGVTLGILGTKGLYKAFKNVSSATDTSNKNVVRFGVSLASMIAGGALAGSSFGALGASIGALTGALGAGITAIVGWNAGLTELANSKIFGTLSVSVSDWTNMLNNSSLSIDTYSAKMEAAKSKVNDLDTSFQNNMNTLGEYLIQYGDFGKTITDEDLPKFTEALEGAAKNATDIIDTNVTYNAGVLKSALSGASTLTDEEVSGMIKSIYTQGENEKNEVQRIKNEVYQIRAKANGEHRNLNLEEEADVANHMAELTKIETGEVQTANSELDYLHRKFNDDYTTLDENSYKSWAEAKENYRKTESEKIQKRYDAELLALDTSYKGKSKKDGTYQKAYDEIVKRREDSEKELSTALEGYDNKIYKDLANTYTKIEGKTDDASNRQRKTIENIFERDLNIKDGKLISQFAKIGSKAGRMCAENFVTGINSKEIKLKINTKNTDRNGNLPLIASAYSRYATGGFPPVGQMFIAGEKGAELVGSVGGKTFVANQNQMGDFLSKNFGGNGGSKQPATFNIYLDHNHKLGSYVLEDLTDKAIANGKPITIGA